MVRLALRTALQSFASKYPSASFVLPGMNSTVILGGSYSRGWIAYRTLA
jgi:hypothetical protein